MEDLSNVTQVTDQPATGTTGAQPTTGGDENMSSQATEDATGAGTNGALPAEYQPYSQFPWEELPEEARGEFLTKLKQFHGDMSRNQNELGELRKTVGDFRQKAQWFDELTSQKWFMDAYMRQQQPQGATAPGQAQEASFEKLTDYGVDPQASKLMGQSVQAEVQRALAPLAQQLQALQQSLVSQTTQTAIERLKEKAAKQGWPDPSEHLTKMSDIIARAGVRDVETAYKMAVFDDILKATETRARTTLKDELARKASQTVAPYAGPAEAPGEEQFVGADAVLRAFQQSKTEFSRRR